jgi:hypothetical protein
MRCLKTSNKEPVFPLIRLDLYDSRYSLSTLKNIQKQQQQQQQQQKNNNKTIAFYNENDTGTP